MAKTLYAEDDLDLAAFFIDWLRKQNHEVVFVQSGLEALEHLEFAQYDIAILDYNLPDMDGFQVCQSLRAKGFKTPIILLTGRSETSVKTMGLQSGANMVLTKPPDFDALQSDIERLTKGDC
jgi:DNA-binding response OmpR family regulator